MIEELSKLPESQLQMNTQSVSKEYTMYLKGIKFYENEFENSE
ncbi:20677_t:CDS:1, partial [Racocetra persica]